MTVLTEETFSGVFSFFVTSNNLDVSIKLRPYGGLIGMKTIPWKNFERVQVFMIARFFARCSQI